MKELITRSTEWINVLGKKVRRLWKHAQCGWMISFYRLNSTKQWWEQEISSHINALFDFCVGENIFCCIDLVTIIQNYSVANKVGTDRLMLMNHPRSVFVNVKQIWTKIVKVAKQSPNSDLCEHYICSQGWEGRTDISLWYFLLLLCCCTK